jgi:hypothetical protein
MIMVIDFGVGCSTGGVCYCRSLHTVHFYGCNIEKIMSGNRFRDSIIYTGSQPSTKWQRL